MSIPTKPQSTVSSPCIAVCELNRVDICKGCHRSKEEISQWRDSNNEQRMQILENAYQRALKMQHN